jgi:hypothetical protein
MSLEQLEQFYADSAKRREALTQYKRKKLQDEIKANEKQSNELAEAARLQALGIELNPIQNMSLGYHDRNQEREKATFDAMQSMQESENRTEQDGDQSQGGE